MAKVTLLDHTNSATDSRGASDEMARYIVENHKLYAPQNFQVTRGEKCSPMLRSIP